jgi:hypothetical protein
MKFMSLILRLKYCNTNWYNRASAERLPSNSLIVYVPL